MVVGMCVRLLVRVRTLAPEPEAVDGEVVVPEAPQGGRVCRGAPTGRIVLEVLSQAPASLSAAGGSTRPLGPAPRRIRLVADFALMGACMERRRHARHPRYFPLRFGVDEEAHEARTRDLSSGGLFVATDEELAPGTRLWLEIFIVSERPLHLEGVVVRRLASLPARRREGGFAVRLLAPAESLAPYLPHARAAARRLPPVTFETRTALDRAAQQGLSGGFFFIWSDVVRAVGDGVEFLLRFAWTPAQLEVRGVVTQVVEDAGRVGLALALDDADAVRTALTAALEGA
jgi:hypothetical protein